MRKRLKPNEAELLGLQIKENTADGNAKYNVNKGDWDRILEFRISNNSNAGTEKPVKTELSEAKPFVLSAWNDLTGRILDINEYCSVHNLPREDVRSYKLITHTAIPYYNIQFKENVTLDNVLDFDFISEIVKSHVKAPVPQNIIPSISSWVDRLIITDVHINMNNHGGANKLPIYNDPLYDEDEIFRRLRITCNHVISHKKSDSLVIDNAGDYMDGEKGQTTRGGHSLPQLYSDKKAFEIGVRFKVELAEILLESYSEITFNNIIDDNHSFLMGYYVHSTAKKVLEAKYPNRVTYNIIETFISNYFLGKHRIVLSHGKDSVEMKFGWKPRLDDKLVKSIDGYLKHHGLYDGKTIEVGKGDSHQYISDYTTSVDFEYHTYPSFSPPSSWVQHNFQNSRSGIVFQNLDMESPTKIITPKFF